MPEPIVALQEDQRICPECPTPLNPRQNYCSKTCYQLWYAREKAEDLTAYKRVWRQSYLEQHGVSYHTDYSRKMRSETARVDELVRSVEVT